MGLRRGSAGVGAVLLVALSGCGSSDDPPEPARGALLVTVTLTRQGPPGPSLEKVPQPDVPVTVTGTSGASRTARTDRVGETRFTLAPGAYLVDVNPYCPDAPRSATVVADQTVSVRFDCVAP